MIDENNIRVRFDEGETGWAIQLKGHALVIINNVPLTNRYCLHDIVELLNADDPETGILGKVVYRKFERRTPVEYDEQWQFHRMCGVLQLLGASVEGMMPPNENHRGMLMAAHHDDIDPRLLAEGLGITQPDEVEEESA